MHLVQQCLQQPGQPGGAEAHVLVGRDHHHLQVLHLRVFLQEPTALRRQAVAEAWVGVHLHLQEHHRARARRRGGGCTCGYSVVSRWCRRC
ncbi:hypothetical protein NZK33_19195 [Cyanobium sp. FGCU-6]|nr:hypothetical protein [Cyanobium sp. FGCU6]